MTIKREKTNEKPVSSIDPDVGYESNANGSSARKYISPVSTNNKKEDDTVVKNSEHYVNNAIGLKSVAVVSNQIASDARQALLDTRAAIAAVSSKKEKKAFGAITSDADTAKKEKIASAASAVQKSDKKSVNDLFGSTSKDIINNSSDVFMKKAKQGEALSPPLNSAVPEIDHVSVEVDEKKGSIDCFYSRVTFSIKSDKIIGGKVKAIRIFRATTINPVIERAVYLSHIGIDKTMSKTSRTHSKNTDYVSSYEKKLQDASIDNAVTKSLPFDKLGTSRISVVNTTNGLTVPSFSAAASTSAVDGISEDVSSYVSSNSLTTIDKSVANDLNSLKNIRDQRGIVDSIDVPGAINVGRMSITTFGSDRLSDNQVITAQDALSNNSSLVVNANNSPEFREVALLTPDKLNSKTIGDYVEFYYDDPSVSYGKAYMYYIVTVDPEMNESIRSAIVKSTIDGVRVPEYPSNVYAVYNVGRGISLSINVSDKLVEKFEVYRREVGKLASIKNSKEITTLSNLSGFTVETTSRDELSNMYIQVGEALNSAGGSLFFDRDVTPGKTYSYRVYSVDVFGNKSEAPKEVSLFVRDNFQKVRNITSPSLMAEIDQKTNKMKLTFSCLDSRVKSLFLSRKDLTVNQQAFTVPGQVSLVRFGSRDQIGNGGYKGEYLSEASADFAWTGYFENTLKDIVFLDKTVDFDRTYQYSMYGTDLYGNKTSVVTSNKVLVVRNAMVNAPKNLRAQVLPDRNGGIACLKVEWDEDNAETSSEDKLGSQTSLSDTSVRTLYQLERKRVGEDKWHEFPLVQDKFFFDWTKAASGSAPSSRPEYLDLNETYIYRVQALQTGNYISNFSDALSTYTGLPAQQPQNFRARMPVSKIRPFYVALNWDTLPNTGIVDRWEIQKAEVNNFAASKLNSRNVAEFDNIVYVPFKTIYRESSRFSSRTLDEADTTTNNKIYTGQNYFQDMAVQFGNTYFYRIRAVALDGSTSNWVYRGAKVTDSLFEKKLNSLLTKDEKARLTNSYDPMSLKDDALSHRDYAAKTSFSLQSQFAKPNVASTLDRVSVVEASENPPQQKKPLQQRPFVAADDRKDR